LVAELENTANQMDSMVREFGGAEALGLRQQAVQAFNADHHEEAIGLLRRALELSIQGGIRGGATKIKTELSMILTQSAVAIANEAQQEASNPAKFGLEGFGNLDRFGQRDASLLLRFLSNNPIERMKGKLGEADSMLAEAIRLDPSNERATQNRGILQRLRDQLP
jgi:tetratricopeptide (TPR) repeat protein